MLARETPALQNPKPEIRIPKEIRNPNQAELQSFGFRVRLSDFGIQRLFLEA